MIRKLTKKVWYDNELWDVVDIISPNKHEDFIILKCMRNDLAYDDGTIASDFILIDAHNDEFFPNTKQNSKIMKEMRANKAKLKRLRDKHYDKLINSWLKVVVDRDW
jgi:hypothetical protein